MEPVGVRTLTERLNFALNALRALRYVEIRFLDGRVAM